MKDMTASLNNQPSDTMSSGDYSSTAERPTDAPSEVEPDYRFTLANERTFLAWERTALALLAAAVAVAQLVPELTIPGARQVLGVLLAVLATATEEPGGAGGSDHQRLGRPLPMTTPWPRIPGRRRTATPPRPTTPPLSAK